MHILLSLSARIILITIIIITARGEINNRASLPPSRPPCNPFLQHHDRTLYSQLIITTHLRAFPLMCIGRNFAVATRISPIFRPLLRRPLCPKYKLVARLIGTTSKKPFACAPLFYWAFCGRVARTPSALSAL